MIYTPGVSGKRSARRYASIVKSRVRRLANRLASETPRTWNGLHAALTARVRSKVKSPLRRDVARLAIGAGAGIRERARGD